LSRFHAEAWVSSDALVRFFIIILLNSAACKGTYSVFSLYSVICSPQVSPMKPAKRRLVKLLIVLAFFYILYVNIHILLQKLWITQNIRKVKKGNEDNISSSKYKPFQKWKH
jgi:hypothetical protein